MSLLYRNIQLPLFAPDSGAGNTGQPTSSGSELTKDDMIEFMADDEESDVIELGEQQRKTKEKTEDKTTRKSQSETTEETETDGETDSEESDEESDEDEELSELESEIQGPTEEQLELVTPVRRREILKKYPNLFKDFPYLEKAYYREQQFTELLPTIEDARNAVEKSQILDNFEVDVIQNGNTENILKAVKEENPNSFYKLVDNYLPTLAKVDEKAYLHLLGNISKHTIVAMTQEARRLGLGENGNGNALQMAAQILNQFVFGSSEFSPPSNLAKDTPDTKKTEEIQERETAFLRRQLDSSVGDLNTRVNNTLRNTINAHIDPKKSMTDYIRGKASQDALDELNRLLSQDSRFKAIADKLWDAAIRDNLSKESVDRVKTAYLSKSKSLLPTVIKKARIDALKGMGKRVREESDEEEETSTRKRGPIMSGAPRSNNSGGKIKKAADIPKGMSTLEFLNSE